MKRSHKAIRPMRPAELSRAALKKSARGPPHLNTTPIGSGKRPNDHGWRPLEVSTAAEVRWHGGKHVAVNSKGGSKI